MEAWRAAGGSRLVVFVGVAASVVWGVVVTVATGRFVMDTLGNPALTLPIKAGATVVVPAVMLVLVVSLPVNWLMYLLVWLDARRSRDPHA